MVRFICGLALVLLIVTPSLGQQSLVGTYKLLSLAEEIDGKPIENYGKAPHGYLVLTTTRVICFHTADNRKFGTTATEKAALLDTMVGWLVGLISRRGRQAHQRRGRFVGRKHEWDHSRIRLAAFGDPSHAYPGSHALPQRSDQNKVRTTGMGKD